jgi:hypothetical protein
MAKKTKNTNHDVSSNYFSFLIDFTDKNKQIKNLLEKELKEILIKDNMNLKGA